MEAETTNNINNFSYIFWILGGITISCIITLTAKSIKKHTFKNILTQAFLHSSFITLSNNLYKINLYNNHPYHLTPPESIYYKIMVSILCIFICLVLIYVIYEKPKDDKFMEMDQSITNYLNHFELTTQKLAQQKENLKNALQSELFSQSEYEEKLKQIEAKIEKEHQITDRIKEHQAKVEKLRILEQKKEDLVNLYNNNILTQEEYHKKLEEITKEKNTYVADINKELEFINNFMNKINEENKVREDDKKSVKNLIKEKNEKLAILRKQYLFRTIDESTYNKKLKELDEEYNKKI